MCKYLCQTPFMLAKESQWAHTVVYALFKHYDIILLKYYFLIGFMDFLVSFQYYYGNIMIPEKVHKAYYKMIFKKYTTVV